MSFRSGKKREKIRVIQFGLGAMGSAMAKIVLEKKYLELVGAIVRGEEDNGKDVGKLIGLKRKIGVKASNKPNEVFESVKADIMLHAAVSYVPQVWKQIKPAIKKGISIITIAEEMGYPFKKYPRLCKEMDKTAKKYGASILGSGINPGFAMDILPLLITGICKEVKKITVTRIIDFSPFGPAIQKNIGIGMNVNDFKKLVAEDKLPLHIGLPESTYMIADGLQWKLDRVLETREPVVAKKTINVPSYMKIHAGRVCGFNHRCYGFIKGKKKIVLEELGRVAKNIDYKNIIIIEGVPKIVETMNVPLGNITTTSHAVNLIPAVLNLTPGLHSMKDLAVAPALLLK